MVQWVHWVGLQKAGYRGAVRREEVQNEGQRYRDGTNKGYIKRRGTEGVDSGLKGRKCTGRSTEVVTQRKGIQEGTDRRDTGGG